MLQAIRNSHFTKIISLLLVFQMLVPTLDFSPVYAGDGGPTQPEVHSFEPVGTDQMVDLFTGDFTYNIPLFNLPGPDGGYPINLAYHSGVQMEQEASWVGLGWNINMGTINRQIRNLPDDFGGEGEKNITIKTDMKPSWTVGAGYSTATELAGFNIDFGSSASLGGVFNRGISLYYNNYRGIGYSADLGLSLRAAGTSTKLADDGKELHSGISGDLGFNIKLDSQEGISADAAANGSGFNSKVSGNFTASTGFNSRTGWKQSVNIQLQAGTSNRNIGVGAPLSFANPVVGMQVPNAMRGGGGTFSLGSGINVPALYRKKSANIFFSTSRLKNKNRDVEYQGLGYMYYQISQDIAGNDNDLRVKDVSRENDGPVHKSTRRLAIPTLSYDIYSVTGQGIGHMFRPVRADIGTVVAPQVHSEYHSGNLGIEKAEVSAGPRIGVDVGYNYSGNKTDLWPNPNAAYHDFVDHDASLIRSVYFKNYGELSEDDLVGNYGASVASNKPVAYGLKNNDNFYDITNIDQNTNGATIQIETTRTSRRKRAAGTEPFTNSMILNDGQAVIREFDISYYDAVGTYYNKNDISRKSYNTRRDQLSKTQVGGYIATNESGMRYVYALPAQNNKERDVVFSVAENAGMVNSSKIEPVPQDGGNVDYKKPGTDKYYNSVEKKGYSHSYMLTSILGTDYVDNDGIAGPSDGDLGYWVRFDYVKAHDNYKWRAPYSGALYDKGYATASSDGKARYSYGEKEIWYVATVETKTHVAEFIVSPRQDCKQVTNELDGGPGSGSYYKLDKINVYVKSERYPGGAFETNAKPVQTCHFTYNYTLCKKTPDNNGTDGKLTLTKVHFTYRNNASGSTRPYTFEYNTQIGGSEAEYAYNAQDRWGNYQPGGSANIDYPYINPYTSKATMDERAGLWNLKAVNLPSGGRYEVDYESDSYAYVQNEVAMQMFPIVSLDPHNGTGNPTGTIDHEEDAAGSKRRVYFQLEQPVSNTLSSGEQQKIMDKYIRAGEYLYFKVKINLTKSNDSKEYVAGYARVQAVNVDQSSLVGSNYTWGYVELDYIKVDGENTHFHPFTEAGSRHIRYNQPEVLYDNAPNADLDQLSVSQAKAVGWSLISNAQDMVNLFKSFTKELYGNGNDRLSDIDLSKSYLRLRTPDKIKYGGGHRVKEIRIIDNWASSFLTSGEASSTYGTRYEYDMKENGQTISSGVAAYEPMVGGDEIPLRNPVKGWEDKNVATKTMAQTYTEEPGNESLFPGPTVGYRQVKVMSLNTAEKKDNLASNIEHYGGVTIHEFYTAKDYPVITDNTELETDKTFRKSRLLIPALIVNIDRLRMAATQGYYIELNDMHGKPKGAKEIGFNEQGVEQELSSVRYEYFDEERLTTNRAGETFITRSLKNDVRVLYADIDPADHEQSDIRLATLGTEVEFIPETRYHQSRNISAGLGLNLEMFTFVPIAYPVPSFSWQEEKTGTVVTNKIVSKAGIVKKVTAMQRGSVAETENLVFDDLTGMPLLSTLTNDYGDKIYNYSILAREQYEGAGAAYENIGKYMVGQAVGSIATAGLQEVDLTNSGEIANLVRGDVLLATPVTTSAGVETGIDGTRDKQICHFHIQNQSNGNPIVETDGLQGWYRFTVIRSGRRNLLTAPISSITALADPTINRHIVPCEDRGEWEQSFEFLTIDNVLAINAVELGHHWYKSTRQIQGAPTDWYDNAYFSRGFGGTYAPIRSYAYPENRSGSLTDVNLKTDGVMNAVQLFNWNNLSSDGMGDECKYKWIETDRITMKNPSSATIESRNILNTFMASIYGRSGTEPVGVAANARNTEIGTENFEEYTAGSLDVTQNATNNLNFYTTISSPSTPRYVEDHFDVEKTVTPGAGVVKVAPSVFSNYTKFVLRVHFDSYKNVSGPDDPAVEVMVEISQPTTNVGGYTQITLPAGINVPHYNSRRWRGELYARKTLPNYPPTANTGVSIVSNRAHTGNQCLQTTSASPVKFMQGRLTLQAGKEYQFSGWFSLLDVPSMLKNNDKIFDGPFVVEFLDATGGSVGSQSFDEADILQGTFIDDWQKFTLNFTVPAGAVYVSITIPQMKQYYAASMSQNVRHALYDDLRIQPRDAAMDTYVYNKSNQRLEAQLDANNYATFYYYDDEGNLFLVKRETEKGIITVQESRSFMQKN